MNKKTPVPLTFHRQKVMYLLGWVMSLPRHTYVAGGTWPGHNVLMFVMEVFSFSSNPLL